MGHMLTTSDPRHHSELAPTMTSSGWYCTTRYPARQLSELTNGVIQGRDNDVDEVWGF